MEILLIVIVFILGLVIGSFINALEYRLEKEKSIKGRSFCPNCEHQLAWYDLVPVFSFIFLCGKCRYCQKKISLQYPIVELLGGLGFAAMAYQSGYLTQISVFLSQSIESRNIIFAIVGLICLLFIAFCLLLVALYDQKTLYVLSGYVYAAIAVSLIYLLVNYTGVWNVNGLFEYLKPNLLAAAVAAAPFAILNLVSKGAWMGAGDIEVAALLGFLLGWPHFTVALYFAFLVGSVWGIIKVYALKNAGLKSEMPFAPFLIIGIVFAYLFANPILSLYVNMFIG